MPQGPKYTRAFSALYSSMHGERKKTCPHTCSSIPSPVALLRHVVTCSPSPVALLLLSPMGIPSPGKTGVASAVQKSPWGLKHTWFWRACIQRNPYGYIYVIKPTALFGWLGAPVQPAAHGRSWAANLNQIHLRLT
jgi:hypothetical protein